MSTASKRIMMAYADRPRVFDLGQKCRDLGLEVVGVHNADTALWFIKNERPDLVCMDAELETVDGISLGEKIAADGELAFVPIIIVQDGTVREQMRYPSLCTHFVDRSDDLWAQLRPLLVELLQIEPGAESREETTAKSGANSAPLIDRQTPSTLSRSLQRLDRALVHLESAVERSTADVVRPSADCVDAVFEQFARSDEPAESALAATATKQRNITRKDEAKTGAFTFPLAATTPRAFAPPQVP